MSTLYLGSLQPYSGKSALALALALHFRELGYTVGYMKPLGTLPVEVGGRLTDEDTLFITRVLGQEDPLDLVTPVMLTDELYERVMREVVPGLSGQVSAAYDALKRGRDLLIVEGPANLWGGTAIGLSMAATAHLVNGKVVLVLRWSSGFVVDEILHAQKALDGQLAGIILNSVPRENLQRARHELEPFLERVGLRFFGTIPQDPVLQSITVRELVQLLNGEVLTAADKQDELVENFTIGAMNVDSALRYFLRVPNKAVITGGDRADIQLAALQTSTKALILTGNLYPSQVVLGRAAEVGVPMILVRGDTMSTVETVERVMGRIRLSNARQVDRLLEIVKQNLDVLELRRCLA